MNTTQAQAKPRIRCRHHTNTSGMSTIYVRSTTDKASLAYTLVHSWERLATLACQSVQHNADKRFNDATIVQAAITLPCTGGEQ